MKNQFTLRAFGLLAALLIWSGAMAQINVSGLVRDDNGDAIPGVTVVVTGTPNGTITNIDGRYTISAKRDATLTFSYIGMKTQQVKVGGRSTINIVMHEDVESLEEVVVVGYGQQKKSSLTGAVAAVKGEELLKTPSTNVSSLLGGRLPGISSVQESGEPGLDQASLRIRGSIYSVTYIVDGMPRSIDDIDPNDIESISVLKDGASAAVYGLQSAGGVIIITTKHGQKGDSKITYSGSFGASKNANFPKFMNGPQFANYYNMGALMDQLANGTISDRSEFTPIFTADQVALMTNGDPTDGWDNVDYISEVFKTGFNQRHSLTAQGGNDKVNYFTSLGYLGVEGNIDNFTYKRYNLRSNVDAQIAKQLKLNVGISGNVGDRRTPGYTSGGTDADSGLGEQGWLSVAHQTIAMHPYLPKTYNGLYTATPAKNTGLANSPLAAIYESGYKKTKAFDVQTNVALTYDVPGVDGLQLKVSGAYDYSTSRNKNLDTPYTVNAIRLPDSSASVAYTETADPRGNAYISLGEGQTNSQQLVGQASVSYIHTFADSHNVDLLALVEARDNTYNSLSAYGRDLDFAELPELGLSTPSESPIGGYSSAWRSAGYVFRAKYDYKAKYLAEFTGRYDGSYKFAGNVSGKRWGFFPSGSVAWRISSEDFMADATAVDDLKIRASVGLLGSDNVSAYSFLSTYSFANQVTLNGSLQNSLYTTGIANPYLSWEKTLSYNVGYDLTMWGGLLGMEVDVFYNYTYDILTSMGGNYPPSMGGYYATYENYCKVDSKGIDVLLTHHNKFNLASSPFTYNVGFNISYAKTRYLRYPDSPNTQEWMKVTGSNVYASYGWVAEGLYRTEEEIDNSAWYGSRPNLGDIKYKDLNGDGKIDWDDRARIGRSNRPELTFGLNLGAQWKGFDLSAQFTGGALFDVSLLGTYYNGYDDNTIWTQTFKEGGNSPLYLVENAYSIDNPNGTFPRITTGTLSHGGDNGLASTFWFRDGKYLRLKSAQLGYTVPRSITRKVGVQDLRVFVEGSNLFTWTGLPAGIDPESPGVNNGYYPQQKTYMGGVTITF